MKTIAIEGLCFAGKSTLARGLLNHFGTSQCVILLDYSDLAKPADRPEVPAKTLAEEINALRYYIEIDKRRWAPILASNFRHPIVIQDRCFHTLLAHAYSNGKTSLFDPLPEAKIFLLSQTDIIRPDVVFYLDAREDVLLDRYKTIPNAIDDLFKSRDYMMNFREYFTEFFAGETEEIFFIDANKPIVQVQHMAISILQTLDVC